MLAMGLVLVGLPCGGKTQGFGVQGDMDDILLSVFTTGWQQNTGLHSLFGMTSLRSCLLALRLLAGCFKCFPTLKWRQTAAHLLVLAVVPGHGAVRRLGLDGLAVGAHEH